ncbi:uncharacterized protein LOC62_05G006969 [Vanrija pseudolonga]|uniref:Uncharacterized protein n=1 Tax=Vanrija pseudolonga TaxID=143232 RepID=A0AAF1BMI3_9TREE|nr:hypothetical protein LOC62_05G006969 [Vanrija pseudolonga]
MPASSNLTPRPFPPTENAWLTQHGCATTSPINPVFGGGVDSLVPTETEAGRALESPVAFYHPPIESPLTPSSHNTWPPSRAFVGNYFPIPVDSLPTTKPFSLDTPRFSDAQIGVPTAYNAEYPHPLTAYASPAVNQATVSSSRYDILLDELLATDPDAATGSTIANSGKEGIGPPALSLHPDSKDGCGIPENLWLQLTTWDSVKVPVGTVVPKAHPSRFTPGPRLSAVIDRSRRVLPPPIAGRRSSTSEPPSSPDVSTLRRSLSTGNLDTFLRSWSELATATKGTEGPRRVSSFQRENLAPQSPFDFAPTPHLRPRTSLPFNILSPVAEEESFFSPISAVVEHSSFPSPFNHGVPLADTDPARDPTEFIPSVLDEPRDPDLGHLPETPLTPPLDWPMPRYEGKPSGSQPEHLDPLEHHIFLPAGLLPPDDEWAPLATTTLDFSTGNSIWA